MANAKFADVNGKHVFYSVHGTGKPLMFPLSASEIHSGVRLAPSFRSPQRLHAGHAIHIGLTRGPEAASRSLGRDKSCSASQGRFPVHVVHLPTKRSFQRPTIAEAR
jgi:hypothetical protein